MTVRKPPPPTLPHQEEGVRFLRERFAAALFDEQGLGKSKQLIEAIAQDIAAGALAGALIICPNSLKSTWAEEITRHSHLPYAMFGAGRAARRAGFGKLRATFYLINYEAVAAELASLRALLRFKPMALVLDESHRIKTPEAKVTQAVLELRADAAKRYIASGTPIANLPEDLWSQIFFLDDGERLGETFDVFRARYLGERGGYERLEDLRERLTDLSLRRQKEGTVQLPPKVISRVPVRLAPQQRMRYDELRRELQLWVRNLSGDEVLAQAENILTRLVRLAQLASNPTLIDASYVETPAKFQTLDQILTASLGKPGKALVWTSFVPNITVLRARYPQYRPVTLYGDMTHTERDVAVRAFKSDEQVRLLVANPAAAREGFTFTEAHIAIYLDRTFNLVDFLQSQDRIHRLSQTRACEIVLLVGEHTIDEFIDFALAQKHRLAQYTQGDADRISAEDLALTKPDILQALIAAEDAPASSDAGGSK